MFRRFLRIHNIASEKSLMLLGPRMTGKSTLIRTAFPDALYVDLLEPRTFRSLAAAPEELEDRVRAYAGARGDAAGFVVVDEIQKLPELLDVCHRMIEIFKQLRFVLTGSSARKLRRSHVNLLAGRASKISLFPITSAEIPDFDYRRLIGVGGLPHVLTSRNPKRELLDYIGIYLKEEIQAEGLTRSIANFSRFLEVAALINTEQVMLSSIASDAQVPGRTVRDYFAILEDTLLGTLLAPYRKTKTRKAVAAEKFYFFDVGVANAIAGRFNVQPKTSDYGKSLEHLMFCELRAALHYLETHLTLNYWRSQSQLEVDFVISDARDLLFGIEVKASAHVSSRDFRGLLALAEEAPTMRKLLICEESARRNTDAGVEIWPVRDFLVALWSGAFFS